MRTAAEAEALALHQGVPLLVALRVTRDAGGRALEVLRVRASANRSLFVYEDCRCRRPATDVRT